MFDQCLIHVDSLGVEMSTFILESLPRFLIDYNGFNKVLTYIDIVRREASAFLGGRPCVPMDVLVFAKSPIDFDDLGGGVHHCNCAAPNELEWILIANKWLMYVVFFVIGDVNFYVGHPRCV